MSRIRKAIDALLGREVKNYAGGNLTRLTADWPTSIASPHAVLQSSLANLRARSRDLAMNNDYARRFISMVGVHVIGPNSIALQCKAKYPDGRLDKWANDTIENDWNAWRRKGNFDVTGKLSGLDGDRLFAQAVARDGEALIRVIPFFDNEFGFAIQFIEPDHLDESLNLAKGPNGNKIRMGVELDKWERPVAYHLFTDHPGENMWTYYAKQYVRIPADQIIHPFIMERFGQPRGVPWMHSAMTRLNNIGAYEEAEIIAARIGASSMGIWEQNDDADPTHAPGQDSTDAEGAPQMEMEPGVFTKAPRGYTFKPFDVQHPAGNFAPFMKASLRGIASGLLVSYNSLASDLEGVNYSSIRAGVLEERDVWKILQSWTIENYLQPVYDRWLAHQLGVGRWAIPLSKYQKFKTVQWQPRTWAWVDPEKDINASIMAIQNGLTSRTRIAAENGMDFEELLIELQQEKMLMEKYGIEFETEKQASDGSGAEVEAEDDEEDDTEDAEAKPEPKDINLNLTVNGSTIELTQPDVKVEVKNDFQPPATPNVTIEAPVVNLAPPVVNVTTPENNVHVHQTEVKGKRTMTMKGPDGKVLRTVTED